MIKEENRCCDCSSPGYPCRGDSCNLKHYKAYYCDECGDETINMHIMDNGDELCDDCYEKEMGVI